MAKKPIKYCVVDAFTDTAFKGNQAVVCLLEEKKEEEWLQSVASEFNLSETCYLTHIVDSELENGSPRFQLRWFTPVAEVNLCGHATLAAAQYLFACGLVNSDKIEFLTLSGVLIAQKVPENEFSSAINHQNGVIQQGFSIELDFPVVPIAEFNSAEGSAISKSLNGASVVEIQKTTTNDDLFVVLTSGKEVVEVEPQFDEVQKLPGRGMIITGPAPPGSGFDFYSRFFCPKLGINEDPVCGSAHCALAAYWRKKLGKHDFVAYAASPRSGIIKLHLDEKNQRVFLRGKAVVVAEGSLLVDAFTEKEFKGNPAAVCILEDVKDDDWLQAVAREFNLPITCYLTPIMDSASEHKISKFRLRWFTILTEVNLCGHGTLAAAYYLFTSDIVNSDKIEFLTKSGSLVTKKVQETEIATSVNYQNGNARKEGFFIQLDFPVIPIAEFKSADILAISKTLNGASVVEILKINNTDDILIVLPSGKEVAEVEPQFDQIREFTGKAMVITGPAPPGSGFDFYSRVFAPKMGVNEDPVCGSMHCALAPYWCKKLDKCDFKAYSASPRSGVINLHLDQKNQKVILQGKAILVAEGSLLV